MEGGAGRMKMIRKIEFHTGTKEERLPNMSQAFPYIASCAELDKYPNRYTPWHWHKEIEIFYMKSGALVYSTSDGEYTFPEGSGGFVNSNVLHTSRGVGRKETLQFLHIFDTSFISGQKDGRIETNYIKPLVSSGSTKIIPLYPHDVRHKDLLKIISDSFHIQENEFAYELKIRNALSEIWYYLFELADPLPKQETGDDERVTEKIKLMMIFIHENYSKKIKISDIAGAAFVSERACFRAFRESIHMSPLEYLNSYRLQKACTMLTDSSKPVTLIGYECGLGTSSHFADKFKSRFGCTPSEYRYKWQNSGV